ncbi:hypothetical protein PG996_004202 [Apiospora saccharicola]|uniref:Uncharacterized protein n=1 Tax=Apiospora saccharicola TaxID=335842 RepID=A0ABR1W3H2_9PEZI
MANVQIDESKVALVTGGSSGIGHAAAQILLDNGATVHVACIEGTITSVQPEGSQTTGSPNRLHYHACDVRVWTDLRAVFESVGRVDYVFANAGITESDGVDFFADNLDDAGKLAEPEWKSIFEVNVFGVLNAVKLAVSSMRKQKVAAGSIVITTSATAHAAEQSLPIYVTSKTALLALIRALRSKLPSTTVKTMMGASDNDGGDVDITALVYSATATQERRVAVYGKEREARHMWEAGQRWNGRVLRTPGETCTELEEPLADLRPFWFGAENLWLARMQQAATDTRPALQWL